MKNKKGFISMTLVYSFLTLFLFVMAAIMASQTEKSRYVDYVNEKVNEDLVNIKGKSSTLMQRMIEDNFVTDGKRFNINEIANSNAGNGNGLYFLDDPNITDENGDGSTSRIYFYRGTVLNNNVLIRKNTGSDTVGYCFKIIRTNDDGNIRIMYFGRANGTKCEGFNYNADDNQYLKGKAFNDKNNDNAFVGYMFGKAESELKGNDIVTGNALSHKFHERIPDEESNFRHTRYQDTHNYFIHDLDTKADNITLKYFGMYNNAIEYTENQSNAKKNLDLWYEKNLISLSSIVADAIYCADKSVGENETAEDSLGYSNISTEYIARYVNDSSHEFSFKCRNEIDRYSLSVYSGGKNSNYNALKYSVGLPTAIDVLYAGARFVKSGESADSASVRNDSFYMHLGGTNGFWTMTPYSFDGTKAQVTLCRESSFLMPMDVTNVDGNRYLVPVISLKPETVVASGKGTSSSPYIVEVNAY